MGPNFHQPGVGNRLDLRPSGHLLPGCGQTTKVNLLALRGVHPGAHRSQDCGPLKRPQHRQNAVKKAAETIVKRQQRGFGRQRRAPLARGQNLRNGNRLVAVLAQPVELLDQVVCAHSHIPLVCHGVIHIVVRQGDKLVVWPGGLSGPCQTVFGGDEYGNVPRPCRRCEKHRRQQHRQHAGKSQERKQKRHGKKS